MQPRREIGDYEYDIDDEADEDSIHEEASEAAAVVDVVDLPGVCEVVGREYVSCPEEARDS